MTERSRRCKNLRRLLWDKYTFFLPGYKELTEEQMVCQQYLFTIVKALKWTKYMQPTRTIPDDL